MYPSHANLKVPPLLAWEIVTMLSPGVSSFLTMSWSMSMTGWPLAEAFKLKASCLLDKSAVKVNACPESAMLRPVAAAIRFRKGSLSRVLPDTLETPSAVCFAANLSICVTVTRKRQLSSSVFSHL